MEKDKLPNTLLVKHLPQQLSDADQRELLRKFGAQNVKLCNRKGPLKYAAFVEYESHEKATAALKRLHQLDILGKRLSVQYAKKCNIFDVEKPKVHSRIDDAENKSSAPHVGPDHSHVKQVSEKLNSLSEKWNIAYPVNPKLRYSYPPPSVNILTNIANTLASVPRFYVQVLHLMNRMNLPAPFGEVTSAPPLPETIAPPLPPEPEITEAEMAISSTEESELESDDDSATKQRSEQEIARREQKRKERLSRKRPQLKLPTPQLPLKPATSSIKLDDIFEQPSAKMAKKIEIKQVSGSGPEEQTSGVDLVGSERNIFGEESEAPSKNEPGEALDITAGEEGGFGKIEPVQKKETEEGEEEEEECDTEFISSRKLRRGRISDRAMRELSVFKRYERGEPSSRLYLKNIAKQTTERDLRYIFGRYVDWENELERTMFDIRLMKEGRMKGQAFVSLLSADKAEVALRETHGFEFNGKPLVVQFARSSKPKDAKAETKPAKS